MIMPGSAFVTAPARNAEKVNPPPVPTHTNIAAPQTRRPIVIAVKREM